MSTYSIVAYSLILEDRYVRGDKHRHLFNPMPHGGDDFLMAVSAFFESFNGSLSSWKDTHFGEVAGVRRHGRTIGAIMNAGRSGLESDINDPRVPEEPTFKRQRRHIERFPVRQYVAIPEGSQIAYWLFESVSNSSLGLPYRQEFLREFHARYKNLGPAFSPVVYEEAWDELAQKNNVYIEEVRVVRSRATSDAFASMGTGNLTGQYIQVINARGNPQQRQGLLTQIKNHFFIPGTGGNGIVARDPEVSEVSATVVVDGRETTVTVDRRRPVSMRIPLPTRDGDRPGDDQFYSEAQKWVTDLADRDGVTLPSGWSQGAWQHDANYGRLGVQHEASAT